MSDGLPARATLGTALRLALRLALMLVVLAAVLFGSAGRLDWTAGWRFLTGYAIVLAVYVLWGLLRDPGQFRERGREGPNVKAWDRAIIRAYTVLLLALFVVAGLDAGRFGWSAPPPAARVAGWVGLVVSSAWIIWVAMTNTYLSRLVRIQDDRGHRVVSTGPYRFVRHPMYAGLLAVFVCIPLALGSLWGLVVSALNGALFVLRTALEDHTLQRELDGYAEYARRVRYRLIPGVW